MRNKSSVFDEHTLRCMVHLPFLFFSEFLDSKAMMPLNTGGGTSSLQNLQNLSGNQTVPPRPRAPPSNQTVIRGLRKANFSACSTCSFLPCSADTLQIKSSKADLAEAFAMEPSPSVVSSHSFSNIFSLFRASAASSKRQAYLPSLCLPK